MLNPPARILNSVVDLNTQQKQRKKKKVNIPGLYLKDEFTEQCEN